MGAIDVHSSLELVQLKFQWHPHSVGIPDRHIFYNHRFFLLCHLPPAHRVATPPPPHRCVLLLPPLARFSEPSTAGSCMPPAPGHLSHHSRHNLLLLGNKFRCPSSRRKPLRLPWPWHILWCKGPCWDHPPPDGAAAMPKPPAIPARAAGRGGRGSHLRESDQSPPHGTSLPPRKQRASCCDDSRANHVPRGRLPARNKAIDQDGQRVVGRRHTPPSSPLQISQPANAPILLFVQIIFQSRSYTFLTPNFCLTKIRS